MSTTLLLHLEKALDIHVIKVLRTDPSPVVLCERVADNEVVVVKAFVEPNARAQVAECLRRETAVVSRLLAIGTAHPHLVRILGVRRQASGPLEKADTIITVAMEYCPNGDLFSRLEQLPTSGFPETEALRYFRQIVVGVHHLHSIGFAHRDISLENVLLDDNDNAKVCDFGLSAPTTEQTTQIVGKPLYMAPEVALGVVSRPITADVWSLGIVLFILLTGSPLFEMAVPSDPAWKVVEREGVIGVLTRWGMDKRLSASTLVLLDRMLQLDAVQRPQSLARILEMLE